MPGSWGRALHWCTFVLSFFASVTAKTEDGLCGPSVLSFQERRDLLKGTLSLFCDRHCMPVRHRLGTCYLGFGAGQKRASSPKNVQKASAWKVHFVAIPRPPGLEMPPAVTGIVSRMQEAMP